MTRSAVAVVVTALVALSIPAASNAQQRQPTPPAPPALLAQTPPMGWNSYNTFGCDIDEEIVRAQADAMVAGNETANSLRDLGYEFVTIDDCWMAPQRNAATGELEADPKRFPSGIAALADYVHARGLKLGIYSSPGPATCFGRSHFYASLNGRLPFPLLPPAVAPPFPGSEGHEAQDAATFAAWGVDFLKYDRCSSPWDGAERAFALMGDSLAATGRPIVYSINPDANNFSSGRWLGGGGNSGGGNGTEGEPDWHRLAHLVRTTRDLDPAWQAALWSQGCWSTGVADAIDANGPRFAAAGPGRWNDPDMLQVGARKPYLGKRLALSDTEGRTQFSMWAMMAAPLFLGNDLARMGEDAATRETLTNAEVIAIDQDPLGVQGRRVAPPPSSSPSSRSSPSSSSSSSSSSFFSWGNDWGGDSGGEGEVWSKPLADGGFAVALLNRGGSPRVVRVAWSDVAFVGREGGEEEFKRRSLNSSNGNLKVRVRDVWKHADVGEFDVAGGSYSATVEAHGVVVLRAAFDQ